MKYWMAKLWILLTLALSGDTAAVSRDVENFLTCERSGRRAVHQAIQRGRYSAEYVCISINKPKI